MNYYQVYDKSLKTVDLLISKLKKIQYNLRGAIYIELVKNRENNVMYYSLILNYNDQTLLLTDTAYYSTKFTYDDIKIDRYQLWKNIYDQTHTGMSKVLAFGPLHENIYKNFENAFKLCKYTLIILNTIYEITRKSSNKSYNLLCNHMEFFTYNTFPELKFERNTTINSVYKYTNMFPIRLIDKQHKIAFNFVNLTDRYNLGFIPITGEFSDFDNEYLSLLYTKYILDKNNYTVITIFVFNDNSEGNSWISLKQQYSFYEKKITNYLYDFIDKQVKTHKDITYNTERYYANNERVSLNTITLLYNYFKVFLNKLYKKNIYYADKQNNLTKKEQILYEVNKKDIISFNDVLLKYIKK